MKHVLVLSKASGTNTPGALDSLLSILSVLISMANLMLQWKDLPVQE